MSIQLSETRVDELRAAVELLADREDGRIAFAHTFHLRKSAWREWLAPNLAALTSLNTHQFANVVYQGDFEQCLHLANVAVVRTYNLDVESCDDDDDDSDNDDSDNDDGDFCADRDGTGLPENQKHQSQRHQNDQRTNQSTIDSHLVAQRAAKYKSATTSNDRQEESLLIFARSKLYIRQQKETIN